MNFENILESDYAKKLLSEYEQLNVFVDSNAKEYDCLPIKVMFKDCTGFMNLWYYKEENRMFLSDLTINNKREGLGTIMLNFAIKFSTFIFRANYLTLNVNKNKPTWLKMWYGMYGFEKLYKFDDGDTLYIKKL